MSKLHRDVAVLAAAFAIGVLGETTHAVGPNGEVDGLSAKFIDVNGVKTRYYDYGQGEVLVLVHGGGLGGSSTANNWSRNIPGLSKRFRVIAVDRLGQGMTGVPDDDAKFNNDGVVDHLFNFIRALNLTKINLVGHSAGGGTVFSLALQHPELVDKLVLVSRAGHMPSPGPGNQRLDDVLAKCPPGPGFDYSYCRLQALGYHSDTFPRDYMEADDWMGHQPAAVAAQKRLAAIRAKNAAAQGPNPAPNNTARDETWARARAGALTMPILIYTGMQDMLTWMTPDEHNMIRAELGFFDIVGTKNPRVKMTVVNDAGHFPYREHPEQFNNDLTNWIDFWNANRNIDLKMGR